MFTNFISALSTLTSLKGVSFENQEFYPDYQIEIYWEVNVDGAVDFQGNTVDCQQYVDSDGDLDTGVICYLVAEEIERGRKDKYRTSIIFVVC